MLLPDRIIEGIVAEAASLFKWNEWREQLGRPSLTRVGRRYPRLPNRRACKGTAMHRRLHGQPSFHACPTASHGLLFYLFVHFHGSSHPCLLAMAPPVPPPNHGPSKKDGLYGPFLSHPEDGERSTIGPHSGIHRRHRIASRARNRTRLSTAHASIEALLWAWRAFGS